GARQPSAVAAPDRSPAGAASLPSTLTTNRSFRTRETGRPMTIPTEAHASPRQPRWMLPALLALGTAILAALIAIAVLLAGLTAAAQPAPAQPEIAAAPAPETVESPAPEATPEPEPTPD